MSRWGDANFHLVADSGRGNGILVPRHERAKVRPNLIYKPTEAVSLQLYTSRALKKEKKEKQFQSVLSILKEMQESERKLILFQTSIQRTTFKNSFPPNLRN